MKKGIITHTTIYSGEVKYSVKKESLHLLPFLQLADEVYYRIETEYVEPDNSIHCNRGSDIPFARICMLPFAVAIKTDKEVVHIVVAAPTKTSAVNFAEEKYKGVVSYYDVKQIEGLTVNNDINEITELIGK